LPTETGSKLIVLILGGENFQSVCHCSTFWYRHLQEKKIDNPFGYFPAIFWCFGTIVAQRHTPLKGGFFVLFVYATRLQKSPGGSKKISNPPNKLATFFLVYFILINNFLVVTLNPETKLCHITMKLVLQNMLLAVEIH